MAALGVPVHNTWGLRPAVVEGTTNQIAPLTAFHDLDETRTAGRCDHVQLPSRTCRTTN